VIGVINTAPADEQAKDAHPAVETIWRGIRTRIFDELLK
jgi:hypothetical protein